MHNSSFLFQASFGTAIAVSAFVLPNSATAAVISNSLDPTTILVNGTNYSVTFSEDSNSGTTYNEVFDSFSNNPSGPTLNKFSDAQSAAQLIATLLNSLGNDRFETALPYSQGSGNVIIPFAASSNQYNGASIFVSGISPATANSGEIGLQFRDLVYQPVQSLTTPMSFVTLEAVTSQPTAVPTPALLPGLIGFGVSILRKRKQAAG